MQFSPGLIDQIRQVSCATSPARDNVGDLTRPISSGLRPGVGGALADGLPSLNQQRRCSHTVSDYQHLPLRSPPCRPKIAFVKVLVLGRELAPMRGRCQEDLEIAKWVIRAGPSCPSIWPFRGNPAHDFGYLFASAYMYHPA